LREAIASIIFAAPRCSDIPDLLHIKNLFTTKYGKEFVSGISELRPDSGVNRTVSELLFPFLNGEHQTTID
jgi:vacuolar protein sorting-associated protein IST1